MIKKILLTEMHVLWKAYKVSYQKGKKIIHCKSYGPRYFAKCNERAGNTGDNTIWKIYTTINNQGDNHEIHMA